MTDNEKIELLIAGRKALEYALEHCSEQLESPEAVRAVQASLIVPEQGEGPVRRLTA